MTRVRLGSLDTVGKHGELSTEERLMMGVLRRWADAIVITKDELVLIEASIRPDLGDPSKLEIYRDLIGFTPELEPYRGLPVFLEYVYAIEDPVVIKYCKQRNIRTVHFSPPWILDYMRELFPRERSATPPKGLV